MLSQTRPMSLVSAFPILIAVGQRFAPTSSPPASGGICHLAVITADEPIKNPALRFYLTTLLEKGHVTRRQVGKAYYYKPATGPRSAFRSIRGQPCRPRSPLRRSPQFSAWSCFSQSQQAGAGLLTIDRRRPSRRGGTGSSPG